MIYEQILSDACEEVTEELSIEPLGPGRQTRLLLVNFLFSSFARLE